MNFKTSLLAALALAAFPAAATAQFADLFTTLNLAWIVNRYDPAGFASVIFDGDSRLRLTIDQTGGSANRADIFSSPFYNTQGRERSGGITGPWTLSAQVYISSAFNTTTGPLARSDLWGHTGTTPDGGDYMILGFTNASPTDELNPAAADRIFRFRAYDGNTGHWFNLGVPAGFAFDAWHTLSGTSTGTTFEFRIDGALVLTNATTAGNDLMSAMIHGYNFGQTGSYSVYWDNVTAIAANIPIISNQPLTAAGTVGMLFSFAIAAAGSPTHYTASPLPAGLSIVAATGVITGTPATLGTTSVLLGATNAFGTANATLTITVAAVSSTPSVTTQPASQTIIAGGTATFAVGASGTPTPTYQWYRDGVLIPGATSATLTIPGVQAANAGSYTATITNAGGNITTTAATLRVTQSRIVNFSVRALAGSGAQTLTLGWVVSGNSKTLLVRGIGPALIPFGVASPLADPRLTLFRGPSPVATNDDWQSGSTAPGIPAATERVGAFSLPNASRDSALMTVANNGAYTAQIVGANNGAGNALAEVYDADSNLGTRLINASARMQIDATAGNPNPLIIGFVIAGTGPKTVLIRGVGPGLSAFGVTGVLADPQLAVFSGGTQISSNDNWESGNNAAPLVAAFVQAGAFALASGSKDAALAIILQPGPYTVQLTGVGNTTGVALIEAYDTL